MRTADFDYNLPPELVAQVPAKERDQSRLLVLHRDSGRTEHQTFSAILEYLRAGDVLVLNDSRVIPARLRAVNPTTGGRFEILLLEQNAINDWWAMMRPAKRARIGTHLALCWPTGHPAALSALVTATNAEGHRRLRFEAATDVSEKLDSLGEAPLPPYIARQAGASLEDRGRYQTVYARPPGSVAAPTAGLHFTPALLDALQAREVHVCFVTLHVGVGTFAPVKTQAISAHRMHEERYELSQATAHAVNKAKQQGRRVVAAGTTSLRVLECVAAANQGRLVPGSGRTAIFIYPPYTFQVADALLTNFHLPRSTLLMLVSAFAAPSRTGGIELIRSTYAEAIREHYRFYSYGDAMLLL